MLSFRKIRLSGVEAPHKKDYEYHLMWISPDGGLRDWVFNSTDGDKEDKFKSIIIDTNSDFRSVPNSQEIIVELSTGSMTRNNFDYVASIFESPRIYLIGEFDEKITVAIKSASKETRRIQKDFSLSFNIMFKEPDLINV